MASQYNYMEKISENVYPLQALNTTSPRKVLFAFNLILAICMIVITALAVYVTWLLYDSEFYSGWINWFTLVVVGFFIVVCAIVGMRGAHQVSLELLLSYFWGLIVLIAPLLLGLFAVFNISFYARIWFKHQWETPEFSAFRNIFCKPVRYADTKCVAPLFDTLANSSIFTTNGTQFNSTQSWCIEFYNATDCEIIRNNAIDDAVDWGSSLIVTNTVVGLSGLILMVLSITISVKILTHPVITQSMLDMINYLLIIPVAACVAQTVAFYWIQDLDVPFSWLPKLYLGLAVAQTVAFPLGIVSGRLKSRTLLKVYITLIFLITGGLVSAGVIGWTLATTVVVDFSPSQNIVTEIACRKRLPGCTQCDLVPQNCPEWSTDEVITLLSLDFRLTGMVSLLCVLYLCGALIVAFLVENNLKNYKSDFV